MMPDETRRYVNPRTLLIEHVTPFYAATAGLVLWEGDVTSTEVDKTDIERAVIAGPILDDLKKPQLVELADTLFLDSTGTADDIRDTLTAHHEALCGSLPDAAGPEPVLFPNATDQGVPVSSGDVPPTIGVTDDEDPDAGDATEYVSQKEG